MITLWLPEHQLHPIGRMAKQNLLRGDVARGPMWTKDGEIGNLAVSSDEELEAGSWTGLVQVWHAQKVGEKLGEFVAEKEDGTVLHRQDVVAEPIGLGGWQRAVVRFGLATPTKVRLRLKVTTEERVWSGLMRLQQGLRPIYLVGHNKNTPDQLNASMKNGANAMEVDVGHRNGTMLAAESIPLPGWMQTSPLPEWFASAKKHFDQMAFIYFDCKMDHVPNNDFRAFGKALGEAVKEAGIAPERCLFAVGDPNGAALFAGLSEAGFGESCKGMDGLHTGDPSSVAPTYWAHVAKEQHLQSIGTGRSNLEFYKLLSDWWAPIRETVLARDNGRAPRYIIHWTLQERENMRKILDLGVDGIITDQEDVLRDIFMEEPYKHLCRAATVADWTR